MTLIYNKLGPKEILRNSRSVSAVFTPITVH